MSVHPARIIASLSLLAGGLVVGVSVLAIAFARLLVDAGMTVQPADAALLDDLIAVSPFVAGFAIASIVAGLGILAGAARAEALAIATSVVALIVGVTGLALIVVGHDPFATTARATATSDGIGIVSAFTAIYLAALVALGATRVRVTRSSSTRVA
jgi:hypothetical protein